MFSNSKSLLKELKSDNQSFELKPLNTDIISQKVSIKFSIKNEFLYTKYSEMNKTKHKNHRENLHLFAISVFTQKNLKNKLKPFQCLQSRVFLISFTNSIVVFVLRICIKSKSWNWKLLNCGEWILLFWKNAVSYCFVHNRLNEICRSNWAIHISQSTIFLHIAPFTLLPLFQFSIHS